MKSGKIIALSTVATVLVLAGGTAWWLRPRWEPLVEMRQAANEAGPLLAKANELGLPLTAREFYPDNGNREFTSLWIAYKEAKLSYNREEREAMRIVYPRSTYEERVEHLRNVVALEADIVSTILQMVETDVWGLNITASPQLPSELDNMVRFLMTAAQLDVIDGKLDDALAKQKACMVIMDRSIEIGCGAGTKAGILSWYGNGTLDLIQLDPIHRAEYLSVKASRSKPDPMIWNTVFQWVSGELDTLRYGDRYAEGLLVAEVDPEYLDFPVDRDGLPINESKRAGCAFVLKYAVEASRFFDQNRKLEDEAGLIELTERTFPSRVLSEDSDDGAVSWNYGPPVSLLLESSRFLDTYEALMSEMSLWSIANPPPDTWEATTPNPMDPEKPIETESLKSILMMRAPVPPDHPLFSRLQGEISLVRPRTKKLPQPLMALFD